MKHFLDKMFRPAVNDNQRRVVFPPLPNHFTKNDAQQRALIGWIARRVGQLLTLEAEETDLLFYTAFSYQPNKSRENDVDHILYFADHLVRWDVRDNSALIDGSDNTVTPRLQKCLEEVAAEYRAEHLPLTEAQQHILQDDNVSSLSTDSASDTRAKDDDWDRRIWQVYRDVIYAATQRKFLLITEQEVDSYMQGNIRLEVEVKERTDITKCREKANQVLLDLGYDPTNIMGRLLVISEAVTNILKHAEYGKLILVEDGQSVRAVIQDTGPGFSIPDLPNTTLLAGYSTKKSLGQGFNLMMKMSDQVVLSTSPQGSTIILVFNEKQDKE